MSFKIKTEYEIKVLGIDIYQVRKKLEYLGASLEGKKDFRRYVYNTIPAEENKRIRLRTDGSQTTVCVKHIVDQSISGTKEVEMEIENFETGHAMLESMGFSSHGYQENKRESYTLDGVEIEIDTRPLIPPYLEIEGKNEKEVLHTLGILGLEKHESTSENTIGIYQRFGIDLKSIKHLAFED